MDIEVAVAAGKPEVNVVRISGRLDAATYEAAQPVILEALDKGAAGMILNMASLDFISSAGLRIMIMLMKKAAADGKRVAMVGVQPPIYKIFKIAALDKVFRFFENEGEADPGAVAVVFPIPGSPATELQGGFRWQRRSDDERTPDVREKADELVGQAREAAALFTQYDQEEVDRIVAAAAKAGAARRIELARMAVEETGMGVFEDKVIKNLFATEYIYNDIRDRKTVGLIKDCQETGIMEFAEPLGVILGITPVTNPTSTAMFKCLIALKTRNAIIISAARNALKCTIEAAKTIYEAALAAGAPDYCVRWVETSSREMTQTLMSHPDVSLILATGGMGMVKAAYGSGTPAIGVGPGNVPVYIEKSADINAAVNDILLSKTFDNGMICASEQAVVVDREIRDAVMARFRVAGGLFPQPGRDRQGGGRGDRRGKREHVAEGRGDRASGASRSWRGSPYRKIPAS